MNPPSNPRRMSPEELQSAADHIRMGNGDYNPDQYGTLTVTEGMQNGHLVYTVTSSRGKLKDREMGRAAEIFGWRGFVTPPNDIRRLVRSRTDWHAEQRGIRATAHQHERRQASSNITPDTRAHPNVLHVGAACPGCAAAQRNAGVTNVTGTVEGGRFNNPDPGAWKDWRDGRPARPSGQPRGR
jgi:hypothetical protein